MTPEKRKNFIKAIQEYNTYEIMQAIPESARCHEVAFLVSILCNTVEAMQRIRAIAEQQTNK